MQQTQQQQLAQQRLRDKQQQPDEIKSEGKPKHTKKSVSVKKDSKFAANRPLTIAIILCVCVVIVLIVLSQTGVLEIVGGILQPGGKVEKGTLNFGDDSEEITYIPEGEVLFRINNNVTFSDSRHSGNIMIENPAISEFSIVIKVYYYHDDVGEVIYESAEIAPGEYIYGDKLDSRLAKGEYSCYYVSEAYRDGVLEGKTDPQPITITVEE